MGGRSGGAWGASPSAPQRWDDYGQLAGARNSCFVDDWSPESFRDRAMKGPGYRPEREIVVVSPDDRIAAFAATWLDELNKIGLLEPVGTHHDSRRGGLARAAMIHGLGAM